MKNIFKRTLAAVAAVIVTGTIFSVPAAYAATSAELDSGLMQAINADRADNGLAPLTVWDPAYDYALAHSQTMYNRGELEHASNEDMRNDATRAGCSFTVGEIIYYSQNMDTTGESMFQAYKNSEDHYAIISSDAFTHMRSGTVQQGGEVYNTVRFLRDCAEPQPEVESSISVNFFRDENTGEARFSGVLNAGDNIDIKQVRFTYPNGRNGEMNASSNGTGNSNEFAFEDWAVGKLVSGYYEFTYLGTPGVDTPVTESVYVDASTTITGLPTNISSNLTSPLAWEGEVTVTPGYNRTVQLQENTSSGWTTLEEFIVAGSGHPTEISLPGRSSEQTVEYRVIAPETDQAEGAISVVTVDYAAPATNVSGLPDSVNAQFGDTPETLRFSVDTEGEREAFLYDENDELVDSTVFTGTGELVLPDYVVGNHTYTVHIPGTINGKEHTSTVGVNVSKYETSLTLEKTTTSVKVGERVVLRGVADTISPARSVIVQERDASGEWVNVDTISLPANNTFDYVVDTDTAGNVEHRVIIEETGSTTGAVSDVHVTEVSKHERTVQHGGLGNLAAKVGDALTSTGVTATGDGEVILQAREGENWVDVDSKPVSSGAATFTLDTAEAGNATYRFNIPTTNMYEGWVSDTFRVSVTKYDTVIDGIPSSSLALAEGEVYEIDLSVTPGLTGVRRSVTLMDNTNDTVVENKLSEPNGDVSFTLPLLDLDETVEYVVLVAESDSHNDATSAAFSVTVREFPTNVTGVPGQPIDVYFDQEEPNVCVTIDNANGREVELEHNSETGWVVIDSVTAPNSEEGEVCFTVPHSSLFEGGTDEYRVFVPQVLRGDEAVSDVFTVNTLKYENVNLNFEDKFFKIGSEAQVEVPVVGNDREVSVTVHNLDTGDELVEVFSQQDGENFITITLPVGVDEDVLNAVGEYEVTATLAASRTHKASAPVVATWTVVLNESIVEGSVDDLTREIGETGVDVKFSTDSSDREWRVEKRNSDASWSTIYEETGASITYTTPAGEKTGVEVYRVVLAGNDEYTEWVSNNFSVTTLARPTTISEIADQSYETTPNGVVTVNVDVTGEDRIITLQQQVGDDWVNVSNHAQNTDGVVEIDFDTSRVHSETYRVFAPETDQDEEGYSNEFTFDVEKGETTVASFEDTVVESAVGLNWEISGVVESSDQANREITVVFTIDSDARAAVVTEATTVTNADGEFSITQPINGAPGTHSAVLFVESTDYAEGFTSDRFTYTVLPVETEISSIDGITRTVLDGDSEIVVDVNGEDRVLALEVQDGDDWVEVDTYAQSDDGTVTLTITNSGVGSDVYRVVVDPTASTPYYDGVVSNEFTVTTVLAPTSVNVTNGEWEDTTLRIDEDGTPITFETDVPRDMFFQVLGANGIWENVETVNDETTITFNPFNEPIGTYVYRVYLPATPTHESWESDPITITIEGAETIIEGWDPSPQYINEENGETTPQTVTANRPFALQTLTPNDQWATLAEYDEGEDIVVEIPAIPGLYRLFAAGDDYYAEYTSETLGVNAVPAEPETPEEGEEDSGNNNTITDNEDNTITTNLTGGDEEDTLDNDGGNNLTTKRERDNQLATLDQLDRLNKLEALGVDSAGLVGLSILSVIAGVGAVGIARRRVNG